MPDTTRPSVNLLGLGIMGSAMAPHLLAAGFSVVGFDIDPVRVHALAMVGGTPATSPRAVAATADIVISVLPSVRALDEVVLGEDGMLAARRRGLILVEASTLPLADKQRIHDAAAPAITVLDCPLSGTGAQAVTKDLLVYASGDTAAITRCAKVFQGFARAHHDLGAFGNGSKMKFVANLLVSIHNVAAAEAFVLGMKAGLEPQAIYRVVGDGAGGSRMFTVRGPQMVADIYEPATMKVETWQKDMSIISDFAVGLNCPTPLLDACASIYTAAMAQGRGAQDTASVCAVLAEMARLDRAESPQETDTP
jgi:3-hydroxyisobutyrate dehydrogenase-like beta-hydroxyacid dehydrogenase